MFSALLERLEEDGLLGDTVICVYDDHYAYGLTDRAVLEEYSEAAGGRLLERTPCFIWYEGCTPMTVDKTLQTVDLLPTLANLFGCPRRALWDRMHLTRRMRAMPSFQTGHG